MTKKRFKHSEFQQDDGQYQYYGIEDTEKNYVYNVIGDGAYDVSEESLINVLNELHEENEQLRNRIKDWHQRTFEAYEYFNILEKVIDEICNDDISNHIWKEYEKREKLIE